MFEYTGQILTFWTPSQENFRFFCTASDRRGKLVTTRGRRNINSGLIGQTGGKWAGPGALGPQQGGSSLACPVSGWLAQGQAEKKLLKGTAAKNIVPVEW